MTTKQTLSVRSPEDLLAAVPCVLGFHPAESLVMLTFRRNGPAFHARVSIPEDTADDEQLCHTLLRSAVVNHVDRIALLAYSEDVDRAAELVLDLAEAAGRAGVGVIDRLRVTGDQWFRVTAGDPHREAGHPFDTSSHRFTAQSVLDGRITHASREDLEATLAPDEPRREAVAALLTTLDPELTEDQLPAEAAWLAHAVHAHARDRRPPGPETTARLVRDLGTPPLRDVAWSLATRASGERHCQLWRHVLVATPDAWAAPPAALLAFAAWLSGQGALAWCAVDRCLTADPQDPIASRVAMLLEEALPPQLWDAVAPSPGLVPDA